jgi:hypothetical protein
LNVLQQLSLLSSSVLLLLVPPFVVVVVVVVVVGPRRGIPHKRFAPPGKARSAHTQSKLRRKFFSSCSRKNFMRILSRYRFLLVRLLSTLPSSISFCRYFLLAFPQGFIGGVSLAMIRWRIMALCWLACWLLHVAVTCTPAWPDAFSH